MRSWLSPARGARGARRLDDRLEVLRGTCFCLLYDLHAWLARAAGPVPPTVRQYRLAGLRALSDPRERLRRYVSRELLEAWERTLQPFFETGSTLAPHLGDSAALRVSGLGAKGTVRAELCLASRSGVLDQSDREHPLPEREWRLELGLSPDLERIVEARLHLLGGPPLKETTGRPSA